MTKQLLSQFFPVYHNASFTFVLLLCISHARVCVQANLKQICQISRDIESNVKIKMCCNYHHFPYLLIL